VREFIVSAEAIHDIDTTGIAMLERLLDDFDRACSSSSLACGRTCATSWRGPVSKTASARRASTSSS
jgi:hypothetical protein